VALAAAVVGDHQPGVGEQPQVLAHRGSADRVVGGEIDHAGRATRQPTEQVAAHRVGQCGEGVHAPLVTV
jgi:hypothetical protein